VVVLTLALAWRHGSTTASRLLLTIVAIIGVEGIRLAILLGAHADNVFTVEAGPWAMVLTAPMILISISQRARAMQAQVLLAQQANAAKSDFLARVSHDLRSPLNTIIGYAGMLRRGSGRLSLREGVDGIEASGKRLLGLIDELLDQSRLSAGKLTLHPGPVVLATWLDELRRGNELRAQHSGNRFSLQQDSPLPAVVIMDGDRLWQVHPMTARCACTSKSRTRAAASPWPNNKPCSSPLCKAANRLRAQSAAGLGLAWACPLPKTWST